MIPMSEFIVLESAERKTERGEPLSADEEAMVDKHGLRPKKLCSCCGKPLGPRVDGEHYTITGR